MYKSKVCPVCGKEFNPRSARQKYCNAPITRICVICGKEYQSECNPTYSKCCSKSCTDQYAHQQSTASYKNIVKTCILCGKNFTPKNNTQQICDNQHFRTCAVCGKSFEIFWKRGRNISEIAKTCSTECKTKLSFANGNPFQKEECREKAKQTMQDKYGVDHPMHSDVIKARVTNTNRDRYGVDHFTQTEAYIDKATATNQGRYGVSWPMQDATTLQKAQDTLYEHFGVTNPMQSAEIKNKVSETYKERTGYAYPAQNPAVKEQTKATNKERFGVEYVLQNSAIKEKARQTTREHHGVDYAMQSTKIREKAKATSKERYGYDNPAQAPVIQAKISDTMSKRYGVTHYNESWEYRQSVMTDPSKLDEWKAFLDDPETYVSKHFDHKPNYKELADALGVNDSTIQFHLARQGKSDLVQYTLSYLENELVAALLEIKPDLQIIRHNRDIIKPYEIDIYLPEYRIGIEMNPTSTHNSSVGSYDNNATPSGYHRMKTNMCEAQGVFLFHIFGYEWSHKKEIIISMLRNVLGCNQNVIYARKCDIREVPSKEAFAFLEENHRQGGVHSKIRYGLYYNNELVSLMTFGKMRNTLGLGKKDLEDCWELVRFCNKLNTSVVGGASRLFKHFLTTYAPARVRSFSDRAHTKGTMYMTLGFTEVNRSSEQYVWVNTEDNQAYNRVNAQKRNLKKFLGDDSIDLTKTERAIMEEHGFVQVYDSGTITWEWRV